MITFLRNPFKRTTDSSKEYGRVAQPERAPGRKSLAMESTPLKTVGSRVQISLLPYFFLYNFLFDIIDIRFFLEFHIACQEGDSPFLGEHIPDTISHR